MAGILLYLGLAVSLFCFPVLPYQLVVAALVALCLFFVPFSRTKGGFIPIVILLSFTFLGNLFQNPGKILAGSGFLSITDEGVMLASMRTLRLFSLVYGAKIMASAVPTERMIKTLEKGLIPLERIGLPVQEFFTIMGLTMQAFPLLLKQITGAYREGKSNRVNSGFRKRLVFLVSFMVPVFAETLRYPERFFCLPGERDGQAGRGDNG